MRRSGIIIVAASAALASGLAHAADLEVVKAEPTIYVPNNFLWSGVYVGGFVGGGWGTADWGPGLVPITVTFTPTPTGTPVTTPVLVFTPHVNVSVPGFVGGGRIGVNYQTGPFVFGFEGDFAGMTLKGHATGIFSGTTPSVKIATSSGTTPTTVSATVTYAGTSVYQTTADWATTFTGRVGYTFDRVLAYGKVGMAVEQDGDTEVSTTTSCSTNPGTSTTPAGTISCRAAISRAGTATRYGWTAGTGIEYAFDNHWSGFVEYDHLGFLSHLLNFFTGPGTAATSRLVSLNIDRVIAGANYRF